MDITVEELLQLQSLANDCEVPGLTEPENEAELESTHTKKRRVLSQQQKKQLILELLSKANTDYSLKRGIMNEIIAKYGSNRFTVRKLWKEAVRQLKNGEDVTINTQRHKCGRNVRFANDMLLRDVPLRKRTTIRSFANALDTSHTTVYRMIQRGVIRSHTNSIKPKLNDKHKTDRMKFILQFIIPATVNEQPRFDMLFNLIHIDEKWFFMTKASQRFYLMTEEEEPYRSCQSKNFITKVMFMAAIVRPWLSDNGDVLWDGKIGIFPFSEEVAARRGSRNRPRGTLETKPLQHINKETIRRMILEEVLPKIREKWPSEACKTIWIQQDNARPHIQPDDPMFLEAAKVGGFYMKIIQQSAQSPDLNILDLGFFRAIQSIQHQTFPDTVTALIASVKDAYNVYDPIDINHTWLHLMYVMTEVLKVKGGNNYKNPHFGKKSLERQGNLPRFVEVDQVVVNDVIEELNSRVVLQTKIEMGEIEVDQVDQGEVEVDQVDEDEVET